MAQLKRILCSCTYILLKNIFVHLKIYNKKYFFGRLKRQVECAKKIYKKKRFNS